MIGHIGFSLRQLQYFVAVADAGTISAAAQRLHVSQPGLSQALTELERAVGVPLTVRRRAHGITLTPSGVQVLRYARELLRSAEDLENVASGGPSLRGLLTLGCYVTLAPTVLPPLLEEFGALHPELILEFDEGTQDVLQSRLINGELDLAILYDMELQPDMDTIVIDTVVPHVLLSARHRLAGARSVSLEELAAEPMILLDAPPSSRNTLAILERLGLATQVRHRPRTLEMCRALVGRGIGWALLFQRPATEQTYDGHHVVIKEIREPVGSWHVVLARPKAMRPSLRAQAFIEFCRR